MSRHLLFAFFVGVAIARKPLMEQLRPHPCKEQIVGQSSAWPPRMSDLVVPKGYPLIETWVVTSDGYILSLFNIPSSSKQRMPVLLMHGLLDSSAAWVGNAPDRAIGFALADAGYDVWLGNVRGSTWSCRHVSLDVGDPLFWRFTWDEMATVDLPAIVKHVVQATHREKIAYVGHSQGTTLLLAGVAASSYLSRHISLAVLLAPVATPIHGDSLLLQVLSRSNTAQLIEKFGLLSFLPDAWGSSRAYYQLCLRLPSVCLQFIASLCGHSTSVNATLLPTYLQYIPAGTSVLNMVHWSQAANRVDSRHMYAMDYGTDCERGPIAGVCNQKKYGSRTPLRYALQDVAVPVALLSGDTDIMADPLDVELTLEALAPRTIVFSRVYRNYSHLDFTWFADARREPLDDLLHLLATDAGRSAGGGSDGRG